MESKNQKARDNAVQVQADTINVGLTEENVRNIFSIEAQKVLKEAELAKKQILVVVWFFVTIMEKKNSKQLLAKIVLLAVILIWLHPWVLATIHLLLQELQLTKTLKQTNLWLAKENLKSKMMKKRFI